MKYSLLSAIKFVVCLLAFLFVSARPLQAADAQNVLATVDGRNITEADIADNLAAQMAQINNQIYTAKKRAVDALIADQLLDQEAKKRNVSREQLLQQEVTAKVAPVSDAEVEKVYNDNKERTGGKSLAELKPLIVQQLQNVRQQQRQQEFVRELRKTAAIKMVLKPPMVNVALDGAPVRGNAKAPITIVEFSDFQCPFCARAEGEMVKVRDAYKDQVKIVYKDFPLPIHPNAPKAAEASRCAREQEKYWEYHDVLFANHDALEVPNLKKFAVDLKLDKAKFDTCLDSGKYADEIAKDMAEGSRVGVTGTPAFFINGRLISGAQPFSAFQEVIEDALAAQ
ncbi:MAG: thioredoxin domain-containing protein [Deltaproteobacteria bacterium]|nr:thioredoxin domain-containing protein [Deltaproteobacteria bacterium]